MLSATPRPLSFPTVANCLSTKASTKPSVLTEGFVDALVLKQFATVGNESGRGVADSICLPFAVIEDRLQKLRTRQLLTHRGAAPLNDYIYSLTDQGRD